MPDAAMPHAVRILRRSLAVLFWWELHTSKCRGPVTIRPQFMGRPLDPGFPVLWGGSFSGAISPCFPVPLSPFFHSLATFPSGSFDEFCSPN